MASADLGSPRTSRAASVSSERTSVAGFAMQPIPSSVKPSPAYVAASVASQIVTDIYDSEQNLDHAGDLLTPMAQGALFSEDALVLVNAFLDYILFCILGSARKTSLDTIRAAILEVLKAKLAREATADADYELANLMGDDEDESADENEPASATWDLDRIWKRTRLRIMVYTRLGEMDDDEEMEYLDYEEESADMGLIPPAAAIYLTSVMESVAEKVIRCAGQAALIRIIKEAKRDGPSQQRVTVEERDAEKIALDSTLGRLWRIWKRNLKAPSQRLETPIGYRSGGSRFSNGYHAKHASIDTLNGSVTSTQETRRTSVPDVPDIPDDEVSETDIAANIPLPMSEDDVIEIENGHLWEETAGFLRSDSKGRSYSISGPFFDTSDFFVTPKQRPRTFSDSFINDFIRPTYDSDDEDETTEAATEEESTDNARGSVISNALATAASTGASDRALSQASEIADEESDDEQDEVLEIKETSSIVDDHDEPQVLNVTRLSMGVPPSPPEVVRTNSAETSPSRREFEPPQAGKILVKDEPEAVATKDTPESTEQTDEPEDEDDIHSSHAIGVARTSDVPISSGTEKFVGQQSQASVEKQLPMPREESGIATKNGVNYSIPTQDGTVSTPPRSRNITTLSEDEAGENNLNDGSALGAGRHAKTPYTTYVIGQPVTIKSEATNSAQATNISQATNDSQPTNGSQAINSSPVSNTEKPPRPSKESTTGRDRSSSKPSLHSVGERPQSSGYVMLRRSGSTAHSSSGFDTSPIQHPRGFDPKESLEVRERKFDDLIRNEETVKYTLTPQNMRDLDITPPIPTTPSKTRKLSFGGGSLSERTQPKIAPIVTNSTKPASPSHVSSPTSTNSDNMSMKTSVPRSQIMNTKPTKKGFTPREPQARHETMFDMADYLRTTSPPTDNSPIIPKVIQSNYAQRAAAMNKTQLPPIPSAQPKLRLQPRSAVMASSNTNDLVNLIREGPPGASRQSDGLDSVNSIPGSTQSITGPSTSRTNLLPSRETAQPAVSSQMQRVQQPTSSVDRPPVTRTQRRVKDPYAISDDEDDDEDDVLTALPKKNVRREESLVDFLNRVEPPVNNGPVPVAPSATALAKMGAGQNKVLPASPNGGLSPTSDPALLKSKITIVPNASSFNPRNKPVARSAGAANDRTIRMESYRSNLDIADFLRTTGPDNEASATPAPLINVGKETKDRKGMRFWRRKD